ncbi:vanin-like protein 3 [Diabrotica undecimpunctata]|uniref:vanin-like protein 3 n=1 Tax=Diabrotica undecimpunctata TaxID=50387 RepID=UPI003B6347A1
MFFNIMYLYKVIILAAILVSVSCQTYKAGIVLYKQIDNLNTVDTNLRENVNRSAALIKSYKNQADIFVLPEYGLTNIPPPTLANLYQYSTTIGEVGDKVCGKEGLDVQLVTLACAANDTSAYIIANLIESVNDTAYYLTTLGFDKTGTIVVKCRKHHISNSTHFQTAKDQTPCTFTANINKDVVKFTILFETDMVYPIPEGIKSGNLIMSSAISNRLPLEFGLSLYQGFAISNGVNLLVSDFTDLVNNYGGSGVFYSNGTSVIAFNPEDVPGGNVNQSVLIRDVPVNPSVVKEVNVNAANVGPVPKFNLPFMNISTLNETTKVLEKCIDKRCCKFSVDFGGNTIAPYKWIAVLNTTILDQSTNALICALALPSANLAAAQSFKNISISTNLDKSEVLLSIPVGLNDKFLPSNFFYNAVSHSIMSTSNDKIVVLGLIEVLGGTPTPSGGGNTVLIVVIVLLVLVLVGLLVAYFIWRKRQEKNRRNF